MRYRKMKFIKVSDNENHESGWAYLNSQGQLILNNSFEHYPNNTCLIVDDNNVIQPEETRQLNQLLEQEAEQAELIKEHHKLAKLDSYVGKEIMQAGIKGIVAGINKNSYRLIVKIDNKVKEWNIPTVKHHLI